MAQNNIVEFISEKGYPLIYDARNIVITKREENCYKNNFILAVLWFNASFTLFSFTFTT